MKIQTRKQLLLNQVSLQFLDHDNKEKIEILNIENGYHGLIGRMFDQLKIEGTITKENIFKLISFLQATTHCFKL